jgi:proteic killer suppression protein
MIRSFRCEQTRALHEGCGSRRFRGIGEQARKRLRWLHAATSLTGLGAIRGNRLEAPKGTRTGEYSIRINDQWRICFSWREGNAYEAEIVDYH